MDGNPTRATRIEAQKAVPPEEASSRLDVTEEYSLSDEGCPTCGVVLGGGVSEPPTSNNPAALRRQAENLRRLRNGLIEQRVDPGTVRRRIPELCPVCRATIEVDALPDEQQFLAARLMEQAELLEDRAASLEGSR